MKKTIIIDGKECKFKSSAAIPRMYRMKFGRDIFVDMNKLKRQMDIQEKMKKETEEECKRKGIPFNPDEFESGLPLDSLEVFENISYLFHKHGDPSQPDDIEEWLEQFETFDIYEILPETLDLWNFDNRQTSKPKKEAGK
ncbi:hypothetical protein B5G11_12570 [Drancourtella sp. An57]|uniref:hypothetical protein n=1 Tax=Drancourtella sp. An57 TaxID=1965647 RepID=UPI000B371751|nr:hypothetical protein [Drancourtella sp. An57]OUN68592.1 hypothetical protein B5G11_12570 [Drancourtella sp. An57]